MRGENGERLNVIRREITEMRTLDIENTDDAMLVKERHGEFGTRFGVQRNVARIEGNVRNYDGPAQCCGGADDAFVRRNNRAFHDVLAEFYVEAMTENALGFVVEQNRENLIVDDALDHFGGAAENSFDIEERTGFAGDFVEQQERVCLAAGSLEKARVFDGAGDARGEHGQNILLVGSEIIELAAFDIEDADDAPLN